MNKKGFTLVELLAVIIILALLAVIASTSVTKVVDDSKNDLATAQIKLIEDAAKTWGAENMSALPEGNSCIYLTLKDLKTYGLIDSDIKNPKTEKKLSNDLKIKITSKISNYNTQVLNYEVDPESVEGCKIYQPPICKLVEGDPKEIGSKYQCKVKEDMEKEFKDGYYFYVLSYEKDGTHNLIMDRNVYYDEKTNTRGLTDEEHLGLVDWDENGNNSNGPITAMNYLENATSNWNNLTKIIIKEFDDELGRIQDMAKTYNVYARLPYKYEANGVGCEDWEWSELCPLWMIDYLYEYELDGYWTLSSYNEDGENAWFVFLDSSVHIDYVSKDMASYTNSIGVRPVINVKL